MGFSGRETERITGEVISSNPFYPGFDLGDFQAIMRINSEYRIDVIRDRVMDAVIYVNRELIDQLTVWQLAGYAGLAEVPAEPVKQTSSVTPDETIFDVSGLVFSYKKAVYSYAKAKLLQDYSTMNRRDKAENDGKESNGAYDDFMADCHDAIKFLTSDGAEQGSLDIYQI